MGEKSELSHLHLQHLTGQEFLLFMTSFVREGAMPACRTLEVAPDHSMEALSFALESGGLASLDLLHLDLRAVPLDHVPRLLAACTSRSISIVARRKEQEPRDEEEEEEEEADAPAP